MAVYYKFKSAKDYDSVSIDGHFISVGNLKEKIVEKKNLGRGSDFDLVISNAQTNEEYIDDTQSVPKNTSVLVRRVPARRQKPIVAEVRDEKAKEESPRAPISPVQHGIETVPMTLSKQLDDSDWTDEFGVDLYTMPDQPQLPQQIPLQQQQQQQQQQHQVVVEKSEEDRIRAFIDASASDWQRQTQEGISAGRGYGRGVQGRGLSGRGFGRGVGMEKKNPPPGYVCHRCGVPGHFIQHCPTNGDPAYDMKKMKPPTGIPKSMLVVNPDGSYALPSGAVAVLRPNEAVFEKEIEGLPSSRTLAEIPPELRCPLCSGVLKDAVLTSRCCFKSYCDKCIRNHILSNGRCICGATNVLADDLLPNKTLRDAINRLLETTATSSAEHAGSLQLPQDMESAQRPKPKAPSPSGSASQKNISITLRSVPASETKEVETGSIFPSQQSQQSLTGYVGQKRQKPMEQTAESNGRHEIVSQSEVAGSQSTIPVDEEVQQQSFVDAAKKKKLKVKKQKPLNGEKEVICRSTGSYESAMDMGVMPYPANPALYGAYWGGPQYMVDGFGQPIANAPFPLFGYGVPGSVPCEMPFAAGMIMPEPVVHPAFMPSIPSFQRDGMDYSMGPPGHSIMSREEFEAKKAELRRKREMEQRVYRDAVKDAVNGDGSSSRVKKGSHVSYSVSSPADEYGARTEKSTYHMQSKTVPRNSLSPQTMKRARHGKKEEPDTIDSSSEWVTETHKDFESSERTEKKPKPSVFSRISFPEKSKERSKRSVAEREFESEDGEGDRGTNVVLKKRSLGDKHAGGLDSMAGSSLSTHESVKSRKPGHKEDRSRQVTSKSKVRDMAEISDEDIYDHSFNQRTSYSVSTQEVHTRTGKRRQS